MEQFYRNRASSISNLSETVGCLKWWRWRWRWKWK
jgi:hypothetical protein